MPAKTEIVKILLNRTISTTNGRRWRITKYQNRKIMGYTDRGSNIRYFCCTNRRSQGNASSCANSVLAALKTDRDLYRQQTVLSVVGKSKTMKRYLKKHKKVAYLGLPTILGLGTVKTKKSEFRLVVTNLGDLRRYKILGYVVEDSKSHLGEVFHRCLDVLEYMGECGYVHGCIRPSSILLKENSVEICMVNFKNSSKISKDPREVYASVPVDISSDDEGDSDDDAEDRLFMSRDQHIGMKQSMRGDLESLAYSLIHSSLGDLPWGLESTRRKAYSAKERFKRNPELWTTWMKQNFRRDFDKIRWTRKLLKYSYGLSYSGMVDYSTVHAMHGAAVSKKVKAFIKSVDFSSEESDAETSEESVDSSSSSSSSSDDEVTLSKSRWNVGEKSAIIPILTPEPAFKPKYLSLLSDPLMRSLQPSQKKVKKVLFEIDKFPRSKFSTSKEDRSPLDRQHLKSILKSSAKRVKFK